MSTSNNNTNNYLVLRSNDDQRLYIVDGDRFDNMYRHDSYDDYGIQYDACDAEDYSPANSVSSFMDDMKEELAETFGDLESLEYTGYGREEFSAEDFTLDDEPVSEELGKAIEEYCEDNVDFATYDNAMNYWDGHNWKTIFFDEGSDFEPFTSLSEKEAQPIIEAWEAADLSDSEEVQTGIHRVRQNGYSFLTSQFEDDGWYEAEVERD